MQKKSEKVWGPGINEWTIDAQLQAIPTASIWRVPGTCVCVCGGGGGGVFIDIWLCCSFFSLSKSKEKRSEWTHSCSVLMPGLWESVQVRMQSCIFNYWRQHLNSFLYTCQLLGSANLNSWPVLLLPALITRWFESLWGAAKPSLFYRSRGVLLAEFWIVKLYIKFWARGINWGYIRGYWKPRLLSDDLSPVKAEGGEFNVLILSYAREFSQPFKETKG